MTRALYLRMEEDFLRAIIVAATNGGRGKELARFVDACKALRMDETFVGATGIASKAYGPYKKTHLSFAAFSGNLARVILLLACGADPTAPEEWARNENKPDLVYISREPDDRQIFACQTQKTPVIYAALGGHTDILRLLLSSGAQYSDDLLRAACKSGSLDCLQLLLEHKECPPLLVTHPLQSSSYTASGSVTADAPGIAPASDESEPPDQPPDHPTFWCSLVCIAARQGHVGTVTRLLDLGAPVQITTYPAYLPLLEALQADDENVSAALVRLLLARGADPNACSSDEDGNRPVVQLALLRAHPGADVPLSGGFLTLLACPALESLWYRGYFHVEQLIWIVFLRALRSGNAAAVELVFDSGQRYEDSAGDDTAEREARRLNVVTLVQACCHAWFANPRCGLEWANDLPLDKIRGMAVRMARTTALERACDASDEGAARAALAGGAIITAPAVHSAMKGSTRGVCPGLVEALLSYLNDGLADESAAASQGGDGTSGGDSSSPTAPPTCTVEAIFAEVVASQSAFCGQKARTAMLMTICGESTPNGVGMGERVTAATRLLDSGAEPAYAALYLACASGSVALARLLLARGAPSVPPPAGEWGGKEEPRKPAALSKRVADAHMVLSQQDARNALRGCGTLIEAVLTTCDSESPSDSAAAVDVLRFLTVDPDGPHLRPSPSGSQQGTEAGSGSADGDISRAISVGGPLARLMAGAFPELLEGHHLMAALQARCSVLDLPLRTCNGAHLDLELVRAILSTGRVDINAARSTTQLGSATSNWHGATSVSTTVVSNSALGAAIICHDGAAAVRLLLEHGASATSPTDFLCKCGSGSSGLDGRASAPPLTCAIYWDAVDAAALLVQHGATWGQIKPFDVERITAHGPGPNHPRLVPKSQKVAVFRARVEQTQANPAVPVVEAEAEADSEPYLDLHDDEFWQRKWVFPQMLSADLFDMAGAMVNDDDGAWDDYDGGWKDDHDGDLDVGGFGLGFSTDFYQYYY